MKIKWKMSIGLIGCVRTGELEIDDNEDFSDDEIDEMVSDAVHERLEYTWERGPD